MAAIFAATRTGPSPGLVPIVTAPQGWKLGCKRAIVHFWKPRTVAAGNSRRASPGRTPSKVANSIGSCETRAFV